MRMYPIQKGPSVPWEVMAPHESICRANHQQSIDRIAERGGFSPGEAWAIVNGIRRTGLETVRKQHRMKNLLILLFGFAGKNTLGFTQTTVTSTKALIP